MARKIISEVETKLTILKIIQSVGPLSGTQLVQYAGETELVDYFSLQLNLAELQDEGQVSEQLHPSGTLLTVTEAGERALQEWEGRIPPSRLQKIVAHANTWRKQFLQEQQAPAFFYPTKDGGTCIRLQLLDGVRALLELLIQLPEAMPPTFLAERWQHAAPEMYQHISLLLSKNSEQLREEMPPFTAMQHLTDDSWQLVMGDQDAEITLMLILPTEELAKVYANNWADAKEEIRQFALQSLAKAEIKKPTVNA